MMEASGWLILCCPNISASALDLLSLSSPHFCSFFLYLQVCDELENWCAVGGGGGVNLKEQGRHMLS